MPTDPFVIGVDLGGTNMQIGLVRTDAEAAGAEHAVLARAKRKTKAEIGFEGVLDRLAEAIQQACEEAEIDQNAAIALGIGAPGAIDRAAGTVIEAPNLRWNDAPLADALRDRLGIPVVVDNDVNVAVLGEHRMGAGIGAEHMIGVWVGTGVGAGLILSGQLYAGAFGSAGEIGHMLALPTAQPGSRSLEHNCSRTAIIDRLTRLIRSNRRSALVELVEGDLDKLKSKTVGQAYAQGDELTVEVVDAAARLLGTHIAGIVTLLSLERVVLGGGFTEALGENFATNVRAAAAENIFPDTAKRCEIAVTALDDDAGVLGAAILGAEAARA
jgi:glucokinase